jgi:hypothetical protein
MGASLLEQAAAEDTRQSNRTEARLLAHEWRAHGAEMMCVCARFDTHSKEASTRRTKQRYHGHRSQSNGDSHDRRR